MKRLRSCCILTILVVITITGCFLKLPVYLIIENHRQDEIRVSGNWRTTIWIPPCSASWVADAVFPSSLLFKPGSLKMEYLYGITVPQKEIRITADFQHQIVKVIAVSDSVDACAQDVLDKSAAILHNLSPCTVDITFKNGDRISVEPLGTKEYGPITGEIWNSYDNLVHACMNTEDIPILASPDKAIWKMGEIPTLEISLIPLKK
jgi:hypothetical protein